MTDTTPPTDPRAAQIAARVTRELELAGIDPQTGRLPAAPPRPALPPRAPGYDANPSSSVKQSIEIMRERAERDQAELRAFVEAVADHFGCKELVSDHWSLRLKQPFQEIRRYVHTRRAEAARRAAVPAGTPGRDASGKFVRGS